MFLQNKNWLYFTDKIIQYSQSGIDLNSFGISDREEADIILKTKENFKILKLVYQNFYVLVGRFLRDYLYNLPILEQDAIDEDLRLGEYKFLDFNSNYDGREIINTSDSFYYHFGRFPGKYNIIPVPKGGIPGFTDTKDVISPLKLYKKSLSNF